MFHSIACADSDDCGTCIFLGDFDVEEDDIPRTEFKPPPVIPKEDNRVGCNKKAYFVCNEGTLHHCHLQIV